MAITPEDHRRRVLYQLINREQHFISALQFGMDRFVTPMKERKDLISPNDHKVLFQNIDELMQISEDILEQLIQEDVEPHIHFASRVYLSKTTAICAAYKKYCTGLKKADCVLVNKSRNLNSDFMKFITEPSVPRKRPDLTTFIHRPLQHFRELFKLVQLLASYCRLDTEEFNNFSTVINEIQAAYREITTSAGLMEPLCDGRPLLTLQDLEARLVFTKCKPFVLAAQGRQWIFGGDLSRVEGKSVKPYWTLLFSDILLFAKVSRDRVLFITEDPIPLAHIVDSCFTVKRKGTEFRLTTDPNGRAAESPTVHCGPDITRTPRKNSKRKSIILRAPSPELKAVWQNLITRQIFLANAALGSTPLSSPLDSPDIMQTLLPYGEIGATTTSVSSVKLSMDNIHYRNQQVRPLSYPMSSYNAANNINNTSNITHQIMTAQAAIAAMKQSKSSSLRQSVTNVRYASTLQGSISELPEITYLSSSSTKQKSNFSSSNKCEKDSNVKSQSCQEETEFPRLRLRTRSSYSSASKDSHDNYYPPSSSTHSAFSNTTHPKNRSNFVEFSLSSVGRSFIDTGDDDGGDDAFTNTLAMPAVAPKIPSIIPTPETPPPNVSPSSSTAVNSAKNSETFSNNGTWRPPSPAANSIHTISPIEDQIVFKTDSFGGSWDLLELDLDFHQVNLDPSLGNIVEELVFLGDDPYGMLPSKPTEPNLMDL